jgi:hypothetical protein
MGDRAEGFRAAAKASKPELGPGELLLLDEACRLVDRLDRYDALISGDAGEWATLEQPNQYAPAALVISISSVVAEARQTVSELRQVVKALDLPAAAVVPKAGTGIFDKLRAV